jgi:hypothetical protein
MVLKDLLEQHKPVILKKWIDVLVNSYHADASQFIKTSKNPFANPVGNTISSVLDSVLDVLVYRRNTDTIESSLDLLLRIRAVQAFSPSKAVSFIFSLKQIIRDILKKQIHAERMDMDLYDFDSSIDQLGLVAFDIYMKCREKIYDVKANEEKNRTFRAFNRAGLLKQVD